jgi:hypothetical protein
MIVYAVPLVLSLATGTLHAAEHVAGFVSAERDRLVAIGLVHDFNGAHDREAPPSRAVALVDESTDPFVHEHGGTAHAHGGPLSGALDGEWVEAGEHEEGSLGAVLALHLPTPCHSLCEIVPLSTVGMDSDVGDRAESSLTPPLPPPRA